MGVDPRTLVTPRARLAAALAFGLLACLLLATASAAAATTLRVNSLRDELVPHDGKCSLREAITAVDSPGLRTDCGKTGRRSNAIVLRRGRYVLSIAPAGGDDNTSGDLNVTGTAALTISGAGTIATVIDAGRLGDRVLSVAGTATLTLRGLRITGGHPPGAQAGASGRADASCAGGGAGADGEDAGDVGSGGGIFNGGTLILDGVAVIGNTAGAGGTGGAAGSQSGTDGCSGGDGGQGGSGGGVYNRGGLTVTDSTIRGNAAGAGGAGGAGGRASPGSGGSGGSGGGIFNQGRLSVTASTIYRNRAGVGGVGGQGGAGAGLRGAGGGGQGGLGGGIASDGGRLLATNSTLVGNLAGAGGAGGSLTGTGGNGGDGGAVAVTAGAGTLRNATVAENAVGAGGARGSATGIPGAAGLGGGLFAESLKPADDMRLQNTIVASNVGSGCAGTTRSAIANGGHDLSYGDRTCPGRTGNPKLGPLQDNGGAGWTMALRPGSAAIDRGPRRRSAGCPSTDQRGVRRPEGRACDIGAYEFAIPTVTVVSPSRDAYYLRGSRIIARFRCDEGGIANAVATCKGSVRGGHAISTGRSATQRFVVRAVDKAGNRARTIVRYHVFEYVNPVREVSGLTPRRVDLGVDYAGSGPLLALGNGVVTMATDSDSGPSSCWAISCWPGGGIVVYRLLDGPFAGKYVYVAEHITVTVRAGQRVTPGQQIATLYPGYPWSEFGWAAGPGPEALAMADGHRCPCGDPGGWSTIDGRDFDHLLVRLGAPSGWFQSIPSQSMPHGWPSWSG